MGGIANLWEGWWVEEWEWGLGAETESSRLGFFRPPLHHRLPARR